MLLRNYFSLTASAVRNIEDALCQKADTAGLSSSIINENEWIAKRRSISWANMKGSLRYLLRFSHSCSFPLWVRKRNSGLPPNKYRKNLTKAFCPRHRGGLLLARYQSPARTSSCSTQLRAGFGDLTKGQTVDYASQLFLTVAKTENAPRYPRKYQLRKAKEQKRNREFPQYEIIHKINGFCLMC